MHFSYFRRLRNYVSSLVWRLARVACYSLPMQYHPVFLKSIIPNLRRAVQITLLIAFCLMVIASPNGRAQTSKKNPVRSESKPANKRAASNKPLTAADYRTAEQRLSDLGYWT